MIPTRIYVLHGHPWSSIIGYDPQLLLTDQRSGWEKACYAEGLRARDEFREAYPSLKDFYNTHFGETYEPVMTNPPFHIGGTITGRFPREPEMQRLLPRGEAILPKDHPMVQTDFGKLEARVLSSYRIPVLPPGDEIRFTRPRQPSFRPPTFYLSVAGTEKFRAAMQRAAEAAREASEKMLLLALYGGSPFTRPRTPDEKRGRRILDLMGSRDRRQRKRGLRLFRQWMRQRPGINWRT